MPQEEQTLKHVGRKKLSLERKFEKMLSYLCGMVKNIPMSIQMYLGGNEDGREICKSTIRKKTLKDIFKLSHFIDETIKDRFRNLPKDTMEASSTNLVAWAQCVLSIEYANSNLKVEAKAK